MAPTHKDCGCAPRLLTPVELVQVCGCGFGNHLQTVAMPTSSPVGTLKELHVTCACGSEVTALYLVGEL